jgi:MFS transporter, OPA family, sugar phosphate sensor protein UhpC
VFYLLKVKGVADAAQAAFMVSGLEVGGLAGSLLAGRLADRMVNTNKKGAGSVGMRVRVVMAYTIGIAACLFCFKMAPAGIWALQWAVVFMLGFFIYGPQMLIGLCGAELVGPESVGASEGFLGCVPVSTLAFVAPIFNASGLGFDCSLEHD